jgi:hypothetical protein
MIVGQQIERHGGNLRQQLVERRRVGRTGNVVAISGPYRPSSSRAAGSTCGE